MPKLPDFTALNLEQPHPSGIVPHYSPKDFVYTGTRGGEYIGRALQQVGHGLEQIGVRGQQEEKKADALQSAQADADVTIGLAKVNSDLSKDPNYENWPQKWEEGSSAVISEAGQRFSNPAHKQEFTIRQQQRVALGSVNVGNEVFKRRGDAVVEENRTKDEELYQSALNDPDPKSADAKIKEIHNLHAGAVQAGYADPRKTDAYLRKRTEQFGEDWLKLQPEEQRLEILKQRLPIAAPSSRVNQLQSGIRNKPISGELEGQLGTAAQAAGVSVDVISGGQPSSGPDRVGTHRHDLGNAADIKLYDVVDGKKRYLSQDNPQDRQRIAAFVTASVAAGATGVGAGPGYMNPETLHVGGGTPGTWGAGNRGSAAPAWLQDAYNKGQRTAPDAGQAPAPAPAQQIEPQPSRTGTLKIPGIGRAEIYGATQEHTERLQGLMGMTLGFMAPKIEGAPGEPMKADQPYIELPQGMGRVVIPGATPEQLAEHHKKLEGAGVLPGTKLVLPGKKQEPQQAAAEGAKTAPPGEQQQEQPAAEGDTTARAEAAPTRTGTPADFIPGHRLPTLYRQAERDLAVANNRKSSENSAENFRLKRSLEDDVARISAGDHSQVDTIDPETVRLRLGAPAMLDWQRKREMGHEVFKQSSDLGTMTGTEIEARLTSLLPDPTQPDFRTQEQIHQAVKKRADIITRLRESDPATSVEGDAAVARTTLALKGEPGNPQRMRDLQDARIAAQERAGIEHPSPITRREAQELAAPLDRILPGQERAALQKVGETAKQKYGDYADEAFAYAIRTKRLTADASRIATRVLQSIVADQQPAPEDTKTLDAQQEIDAAKNAVEGPGGLRAAAPMPEPAAPGARRGGNPGRVMARDVMATPPTPYPEPAPNALPPAKAMDALRADPSLADQFDAKFGTGAAKRVLELGKGAH